MQNMQVEENMRIQQHNMRTQNMQDEDNMKTQQHNMRMQNLQEELTHSEHSLIVIQYDLDVFNSLKTPQKDSLPNNPNNRTTVGETKGQETKSETKSETDEVYLTRLIEDTLAVGETEESEDEGLMAFEETEESEDEDLMARLNEDADLMDMFG